MRFNTLTGLENRITETDVKASRIQLLKQTIEQSKEWQDHTKHCNVATLKEAGFGRDTITFEEELRTRQPPPRTPTTENPVPSQEPPQPHQDMTDHNPQKHQAQLLGNELYFSVQSGRTITAGCGCGQELTVTANPNTDYATSNQADTTDTGRLYKTTTTQEPNDARNLYTGQPTLEDQFGQTGKAEFLYEKQQKKDQRPYR